MFANELATHQMFYLLHEKEQVLGLQEVGLH